ncbi:MAG: hypothetical protein GX552_03505 [Chloroflexi bacterium]|jgi:hypothetical protein|nr:hypothetical protein [Chloroflexota bacterium]
MDDKIKLEIDLFSNQAGNWQAHPANMSVVDVSAHRSRSSRGNLYILIETPSRSVLGDSLYNQLIQTITDSYYSVSGSITRGLRAALMAANESLFESNLRADSEHRTFAGLGCLVIRDEDVYIGQLGPSLVSHIHQGDVTRYPAESVWLRSADPGAFDLNREPPAGLRRDIEPNLYHLTLSPGDALVLSSTSLGRITTPQGLLQVVDSSDSRPIAERIHAVTNGQDVDVILIQSAGAQPSANKPPLSFAAPFRTREARPDPPESPPFQPPEPDSAAPRTAPPFASPFTPPEPVEATSPPFPFAPKPASAPDATVADGAAVADGIADDEDDWEEADWEEVQESPQPARQPLVNLSQFKENLSEGASRLRQGTQEFLMRVLPDALPERPANPEPASRGNALSLSGRALVAVALAIPLVMLMIVITTRVQYERARYGHFNDLKIEAQTAYDTAVNMQDQNAVRQGLYEALAMTEEGLAMEPADETLTALGRRIRRKLDEIDNVYRLYHFWQLTDLEDDATSTTDSTRIVIHGIDVYLLNRGSDRIYKYMLNDVGDALQPVESSPILAQKGELRGGVTLGDMVDLAWMKAGGQRTAESLVMLERTGVLLSYDPQQGIDVLPVADSDIWLKPQAIASYFGNLYVLDPLLGRILKYVPTDNAYTTPPSDYLDRQLDIDLTGAVDMAIDGNLYLLFADGRIVKLLNGEPQPFNMASLPTPMRSPTTIFVSGPQEPDGEGYVYVTDAGNERIVQFDKNGNFVRQFQANLGESQMQKLRGLYVDEERGRMFILSGQSLWLAELPALGSQPG